MASSVERHNPPAMGPPQGSYSQISLHAASGQAFIAGQVAIDADGTFVGEGDIGRQTEQVFANISAGLVSIGADWNSVITLTTYLTRQDAFPEFVTTLRRLMGTHYADGMFPGHTLLFVAALSAPEYLIEVEATVAYDSSRSVSV